MFGYRPVNSIDESVGVLAPDAVNELPVRLLASTVEPSHGTHDARRAGA